MTKKQTKKATTKARRTWRIRVNGCEVSLITPSNSEWAASRYYSEPNKARKAAESLSLATGLSVEVR